MRENVDIAGVECTDVPVSQMDTYPDGFICGNCPIGLVGDGQSCEGKMCNSNTCNNSQFARTS